MNNNSNSININDFQVKNNLLPTVKASQVETYFKENNNSKLLVLKLDDLNASIIKQLQENQCGMILLNENFKIIDQSKPKEVHNIQILVDGVKQVVSIEDIIRFEACGNYTYIYIKNYSKPVLTSKTLKYYADLLDEVSISFVRPHSKHLVNIKSVENINKGNALTLADKTTVQISRRRLSYVKQVLLIQKKIKLK